MSVLEDVKLVARAATGRPLVEEKTDATWSKPGTQTVNGHRRAGRWSHQSYRRRAATAWSITVGLALFAWLAWSDILSAATTALWIVRLTLIGLAWAWVEWARKYAHRRSTLRPLGERLATELGDARYALDPRTWLDVPVDYQDRPSTICLPPGKTFTETQEKKLVRVIATSLGLVAPSATWDMRGERPFVEVRPAPAPREAVAFADADYRAAVEAAEDGHPVLGMAPRDAPHALDYDADAPHSGFSMSSGAGKSVTVRAILAQGLRHGGIGLVLDRKIESQLWAMDLPNVRYACSEREIYNALMWASDEIDRRFELVRLAAREGRRLTREELGPRLWLVVEEINALETDLRIWWRSVRQSGDPAQCPALPVLGRFLAMGRAAGCHALVVAQKLTCQAIGGTAARENLSNRVLGRATTSTWNMLAPECKVGGRYPKSSKIRGRVHSVMGDEATSVQVAFWTEDEAREWALGGVIARFPAIHLEYGTPAEATDLAPALAPGDSYSIRGHDGTWLVGEGGTHAPMVRPGETVAVEAPHLASVTTLPLAANEPDDESLLTLAQYGEEHGIKVKSLQNARDRGALADPTESGSGKPSRYRRSDLDAWREARAAGVGGEAS